MSHTDLFGWGTRIEIERRTRIKLCVAAFAYEVQSAPLMSDAAFDALARSSDVTIRTGRYDDWWRTTFQPYTGSWILSHPDLTGVQRLYRRIVQAMEMV